MSFTQMSWPVHWNKLRDQGRLQWRRLPASRQWQAVIPELGIEIRAHEMRELAVRLTPYVDKLPPIPEPQRVNGTPWPEAMPASRNMLPRR